MLANSDFRDLLSIFNANHVRYLIIGGYAVVMYSEPRYTKDLDVFVGTDLKNAEAVFRSLREFGAPLAGMSAEDFTEDGSFYQMGAPPARVDILMSVPGVAFDDAWDRREMLDFGDVKSPFISKPDLLISKRAAGRPQDLINADLLELEPSSD